MDLEKEIKELKNLPPKERVTRIKKLKELQEEEKKKQEEERKRHEEEVEDIIAKSLHEIEIDEKVKKIEMELEELEKENLEGISDEALEEQLKAAKQNEDYASKINQILPPQAQDEIKTWYAQDTRKPERNEFLNMYNQARKAYDTLKENMNQSQAGKYQTQSEKAVEGLVESMRIMRKMGYDNGWFNQ